MGHAALAIAIAFVALVLTSFVDTMPTSTPHVGGPAAFDVPAGGRWCAPQDELGTRSCRFQTFEHCLSAVSAWTCRPNPAAVQITDEGPYRTYRSLTRAEHDLTIAN